MTVSLASLGYKNIVNVSTARLKAYFGSRINSSHYYSCESRLPSVRLFLINNNKHQQIQQQLQLNIFFYVNGHVETYYAYS